MLIKVIFTLVNFIYLGNCAECFTKGDSGGVRGRNKRCDFPFAYYGKMYYNCLTDDDPGSCPVYVQWVDTISESLEGSLLKGD